MTPFTLAIVVILSSLLFWHSRKLFQHLQKTKQPAKWHFRFYIITQSSWITVSTIGLVYYQHISDELLKAGVFVSLASFSIAVFAMWLVETNIYGHLAHRQRSATSFAIPKFSGGWTNFHVGYQSGDPSLLKATINLLFFLIYSLVIIYSFTTHPILMFSPFLIQGVLYLVGTFIKSDVFITSSRISDFIL